MKIGKSTTSQGGVPPRAVPAVPPRCHLHSSQPSPLPKELPLSRLTANAATFRTSASVVQTRAGHRRPQGCSPPDLPGSLCHPTSVCRGGRTGPQEVLPHRDARGSIELPRKARRDPALLKQEWRLLGSPRPPRLHRDHQGGVGGNACLPSSRVSLWEQEPRAVNAGSSQPLLLRKPPPPPPTTAPHPWGLI